MARLWLYARTSGDEGDTGQDVAAQLDGLAARVEGLGHVVAGRSWDDGVSGTVPPAERGGWLEAFEACQGRKADAVAMVEASRFSRQAPGVALATWENVSGVVRFLVLREGHFTTLGAAFEIEDDSLTLLRFITFWQAWSERRRLVARTQAVMDDFKHNRRAPKSGKPVGRPKKGLDQEEVSWAVGAWAVRRVA